MLGEKEEREMLVMTCFDKLLPKVRNLPNEDAIKLVN